MASNAKIIDKVKKLLSLAESSNANEAFLAAKRARKLMDLHSISKSDIENASGKEFLETKSKHEYRQKNSWVIILHSAVAELNDCVAAIGYFNGSVEHMFQGFTADAVVGQMTLDYLIDACELQCKAHDVRGRSEKNQFRLGFARAIDSKINAIMSDRKQDFLASTGTDLILLKKSSVTRHFGELKTFTPTKPRMPTESEIDAYLRGEMAGNNTGLDKQVAGEEILKLA